MANTYPTDEDELLNISGVGQIKYEKYGQDFISAIEQYMVDNKIDKSTLEEDKSNVLNEKEDAKQNFFEVTTDQKLYEQLKKVRGKYARIESLPHRMIMTKITKRN
ncbi:MAG: HRDC domain-containing protein [Intestinibacter bartlettii]